jgi:hypothetical protein
MNDMRNQMNSDDKSVGNETSQNRKPYNTPTLRVFGDIVEVVQGAGNSGADAGSHSS